MRPRARFWLRLAAFSAAGALLLGAAFLAVVNAFDAKALQRGVSAGQGWLQRYGAQLHLASHGLTYLCLIAFWPRIVAWLQRRRRRRGLAALTARERRRAAALCAALCAGYELLLWSRRWM